MAKEEFLNSLFDAYTKDLNDVYPNQGDVVVCPICLLVFPRDVIKEKILTDGHVWPQYFRKKSLKAKNMRVLLCDDCNHKAGSRSDKQMQLNEQVRDGEESGEWFGSRRVQLIRKPGERPVDLNVKISGDKKNFRITGRINKNKQWIDGSPEDQMRFHEIIEKGEHVSVLIHPPKNLDLDIVPAGWITSAYLMAFYALGYRYILDSSLNIVREYINASIRGSDSEKKHLPRDENFTIREYRSAFYTNPEINFIIPWAEKKLVYLQINFFRYEIRLPFRYVSSVLDALFREQKQKISQILSQFLKEEDKFLIIPINCMKIEPHECFFDLLLGKSAAS